jgi:hypothetical protein
MFPPVSAQLNPFEATAYARMLDEVIARRFRSQGHRAAVRLPRVVSYTRLASILHEWVFTADAILLRDAGPAVRLISVAQLQEQESWPPRGVLAAADATWVLEQDGRVTRLY